MATKNIFVITDCKENILNNEMWESTADHAIFHLTPVRLVSDRYVFDDCSFIDLFINDKTDWGAPIPSTFQYFFKEILEILIPKDHLLILNVVDLYEGYFEQNQFVEDVLKPSGYIYFSIDKEINGKLYPTLFFECPISNVSILHDIAFPGTVIDVDGFVLERSKVGLFESWRAMGNTGTMFRELLRNVYFAFGIWGDQNGMFITTEKFSIPELKETLSESKLESEIYKYINEGLEKG